MTKTTEEIIQEIERRSKEAANEMNMQIVIELVSLLGWIKSNDEKGSE